MILGLWLLAAASSQSTQASGDLESILKWAQLLRTPPASEPSLLPRSSAAVEIVQPAVVVVLPLAPYADMPFNVQLNDKLDSIIKLLEVIRGSPPSVTYSPIVNSPPSVSSTQAPLASVAGAACTLGGVAGVCVESRTCPSAVQQIENRKPIQYCGYANSESIVCCVLDLSTTTLTNSHGKIEGPAINNDNATKTAPARTEREKNAPARTEPEREGCGRSYSRPGENNITSKGEVRYGEFPWTCAVLMAKRETDETTGEIKTRNMFVANGALIHSSVVLVIWYLSIRERHVVRAGAGGGSSTTEGREYQQRDVGTIEQTSRWPTLSLLFLTEPMRLTSNVAVGCLPPPGQRVPPGTSCVLTAWDHERYEYVEYNYEYKLLKAQVSTMERADCERVIIQTGDAGEGYTMEDWYSCVTLPGSERTINKRMCHDMSSEDSIVSCPIESKSERYILSGLLWIAYDCDSAPFWRYVDVSLYKTWIDKEVTANGFYTSTYSGDSL